MIVRKCTPEDIIYILEHPWIVTKLERERFGFREFSPSYIAGRFLENNFGHSLVIIDDSGKPVWAFGMAILNATDWTAWALYSDTFPLYKKEAIELYNQKIQEHAEKQRQFDGKFERMILITAVDSSKVERWCKTIGFKRSTNNDINKQYDCEVGVYTREFY